MWQISNRPFPIARAVAVVAVLAAFAAGQPAEEVCKRATASPGYVQEDFAGDLRQNLVNEFGEFRADRMWRHLLRKRLEAKDVMKLINGNVTRRGTRKLFGARSAEEKRAREVVLRTVVQKDRKIMFGVLAVTMIRSFDVAPSSDFCKQVVAARDAMSEKDFDKIFRTGNVAKRTMREGFGFTDEEDMKFMSDIVKDAVRSEFLDHPMARTIGRRAKRRGSKRGALVKGNAGYGQYADGTAGGLAFDEKLPPLPLMSKNTKDCFK